MAEKDDDFKSFVFMDEGGSIVILMAFGQRKLQRPPRVVIFNVKEM